MNEDTSIPPDALTWLAAAQRDRCCYCGCETWLPWQRRQEARLRARWDMPGARSMACQLVFGYRMASVEHLTRRSEGGGDAPGNLAMACAYCNSSRREATPEAHGAAMQEMVAARRHPCFPPTKDHASPR